MFVIITITDFDAVEVQLYMFTLQDMQNYDRFFRSRRILQISTFFLSMVMIQE